MLVMDLSRMPPELINYFECSVTHRQEVLRQDERSGAAFGYARSD